MEKKEPQGELLLTEVASAPIPPPSDESEVTIKPMPAKKAAPNIKRLTVKVPAGFVLPLGEAVKDPFDLMVEVGIRWHPESASPKLAVMAYRVFAHGDALCWSGSKVLTFKALLPPEVATLALHHGQPVEGDERILAETDALGLKAPAEKENWEDFILPEQLRRR